MVLKLDDYILLFGKNEKGMIENELVLGSKKKSELEKTSFMDGP